MKLPSASEDNPQSRELVLGRSQDKADTRSRGRDCRQRKEGPPEQGRLPGIDETTFYNWLKRGAMAKPGKFREFCQSLKKTAIRSNQPRLRRTCKVVCCGRIRETLSAQSVQERGILPAQLNVFKALTTNQRIVGDVQNVV